MSSPVTSAASKPISSDDPLGMEGVEHWGWAGAWGKQTRLFLFRRAAQLALTMPANWRADCPHGREVRMSSPRDREAAPPQTTQHCATLYSALGRLTSEECQRDQNKGATEARRSERTMLVVCGGGQQGEAPGADAGAPSASPVVRANCAAKPIPLAGSAG